MPFFVRACVRLESACEDSNAFDTFMVSLKMYFEVYWGIVQCVIAYLEKRVLRQNMCEILIHTICEKRVSSFITERSAPQSCFNSQRVQSHTMLHRI